jgi:hypothetical protein
MHKTKPDTEHGAMNGLGTAMALCIQNCSRPVSSLHSAGYAVGDERGVVGLWSTPLERLIHGFGRAQGIAEQC